MKFKAGRFIAVLIAIAITIPMLLIPVSVNALEDPEVAYASSVYLYNLENKKQI